MSWESPMADSIYVYAAVLSDSWTVGRQRSLAYLKLIHVGALVLCLMVLSIMPLSPRRQGWPCRRCAFTFYELILIAVCNRKCELYADLSLCARCVRWGPDQVFRVAPDARKLNNFLRWIILRYTSHLGMEHGSRPVHSHREHSGGFVSCLVHGSTMSYY